MAYVFPQNGATRHGRIARQKRRALPALPGWLVSIGLGFIPPILLLGLWTLAAARHWMPEQILPDPAYTLATAHDLLTGGDIADNLRVSLERVLAGLMIGAAIGVAFGIAMGVSARLEAYLGPTIRAICLVPTIGWLPFFMLVFGIGEELKLAFIAKAAFLPMMLNAYAAVRVIPGRYLEVARVLELGRLATLRLVILPSTLPALFTGLRQALSQAWKALVVVEIVASAAGIGHLMEWSRKLFQLDVVFVTMAVIGIAGWLMDGTMQWLESRITRNPG